MIGKSHPRLEDARLVSGKGRYTDDINSAGQVYAAFLRSPHAHARIVAIDAEAAQAAPGVLAVLTGADYLAAGFKGINHQANPPDPVEFLQPQFRNTDSGSIFNNAQLPLPSDKVRHVGEAVVMVVAETMAQARDAAEQIMVDYDVLDAVVAADDAMDSSAPQLWDGAAGNLCFQEQCGDRQAAQAIFAQADHVIRREFRISRIVNCQMEPRAAIGEYDAGNDSYTLISGSQGVMRQRVGLAGALGAAMDKVRVISPDVGGGFGPRTSLYVEQVAVVWAARHVGRPVKWTGDRSEAFISDYQGRDGVIRAAMALAKDGRILAIDYDWLGNLGAHPVSYVPMANGTRLLSSVYDIPATSVHVSAVFTNTVPTAPYRGAGRPEAMHAMERMLDIAADELQLDRLAIRRRNLVTRAMLPYANPMGLTYDSGDFSGNMARAVELAEWHGFAARRAASRAKGLLRGIGVANYIEAPVGAARERMEMTVLPEGVIDLVAGTQSTGQGHETTFAQVIATQLGVPMTATRLRTGDSGFLTAGGGTHSDRTMRIGGALLMQATAEIIATARKVAMHLLDAQVVVFGAAAFTSTGSGKSVSLFEIARHVEEHGLPHDRSIKSLSAVADFTGRMAAHPTGAVVCELEIDPETGTVAITNYTSVDDVGKAINPLIVEGQVHGGLAQGIGQALCEGYAVDRASGQVMSGSYMDYCVPRSDAMPPLRIELSEDPTAGNPLGVKGGGESGITPATAVIFNALADALKDYTRDELPMPATPAAIWEVIHRADD